MPSAYSGIDQPHSEVDRDIKKIPADMADGDRRIQSVYYQAGDNSQAELELQAAQQPSTQLPPASKTAQSEATTAQTVKTYENVSVDTAGDVDQKHHRQPPPPDANKY